MTSTFRYTPLKEPSQYIRLINLAPSTSESKPLKCHLHQVRLDDIRTSKKDAPYEALSYTWGARHGTVPITCDNQTLFVTPNCESALRHLRNKFTRRVLWIDAICIDQSSIDEKNVQVPLMGGIYSLARNVIIWLGPGFPGDEQLLRRAKIGGKVYQGRGNFNADFVNGWGGQLVSKHISPEDIETVRRISSNPWFRRIWTLQEFLLAKSFTVQIGHAECPPSSLYTYFLVAQALHPFESLESRLFKMRNRALEILQPEGSGSWISHRSLYANDPETNHYEFLRMILKTVGLSEATDCRDKAYGILGLLQKISNGSELPKVDYEKSVGAIFEELTRSLVIMTGSLVPLEIISRRSTGQSEDLASWVPDFRDFTSLDFNWRPRLSRDIHGAGNDEILQLPESKRRWRSSYTGPLKLTEESEVVNTNNKGSGKLRVKAKYLATITEVYDRMPVLDKANPEARFLRADCLSRWTAIAFSLDDEAEVETKVRDSFVAALQDMTPGLNYIRQNHEPPPGEEMSSFDRQVLSEDLYDGLVLFRTSCGLLGLCKGDPRAQDRVWQLGGGRHPFVLHRVVKPKRSIWSSWSLFSQERIYRMISVADMVGLDSEERQFWWDEDYVDAESHFGEITLI